MLRSLKTNQRKERILSLEVDGTGTAAINIGSKLATLVDNGTGDYSLTFTRAFARQPIASATPLTDVTQCRIKAISTTVINIECTNADATTPTDCDFHLIVIGWDTADEYGDDT